VSKELKTGVIAIAIIALFVWGYNFLKDKSLYDKTRIFYAEYTNVQGLLINAPVTISGLKVGKVSKINFHPYKKGVLVAHISLSNDIKFSRNSVAQIYSPDFISGKSLKINIVEDEDEFAQSGDTLTGEIDSGILGAINEQIAPLQSKVESFVVNTDSVMQNLNQVLDEQNQENIKISLQTLRETLVKFNSIANELDILFKENNSKFDSIFDNANIAMQNFSQITDSLKNANLGATVNKLQHTLDSFNRILDSIESGNGTIGKLMKDEQLYNNLENASKELEELLREVKLHPKRFVHLSLFGKKEKEYQENPDE
jgi:phospholipid/cholesterol/gamma-HCH transport system substrate-binding protein